MDDRKIIWTLRTQAWERAKGELRSMMHTFWGDGYANQGQYDCLDEAVEKFVKDVEDHGWHE